MARIRTVRTTPSGVRRRGPMTFARGACALGAAALVGVAGWSVAQNFRAEPIYGHVNLGAGFTPDPWVLELTAGGATLASELRLPPACRGHINPDAPHVSLNYTAGRHPLQIYVHSTADTTLIVNDPAGNWRCDDDSILLNPALRFAPAQSGQYDIWVGSIRPGLVRATLHITER